MIDCFDKEYAFLSNYHPTCPLVDEFNIAYPSVEHYFQALKSLDKKERIMVALQDTPGKAKRLGRNLHLREDWEEIKNQVMEDGLRQKFTDPVMKKKLLATNDEELIEGNTWHDNTWGDCSCEACQGIIGQNRLGLLLMKLREEFKNESPN
jgi:ribA/ribD-fused uncharacterized protein